MRTRVPSAVVAALGFCTFSAAPAWASFPWTGPAPRTGSCTGGAFACTAAAPAADPQSPRVSPTPAAGTAIPVRLLEPIDSSSGSAGREYLASVTQSVDAGSGVIIPRSAPATVTLVQTGDGWAAQLTSVMIAGQKVPVTSVSATLSAGHGTTSTEAVIAKLAGRAPTGSHVVLPAGTEVQFVLGDAVPEQAAVPPAAPVGGAGPMAHAQPLPPPPQHPAAVSGSGASTARARTSVAAPVPVQPASYAASTHEPTGTRRAATPPPAAAPASGSAHAGSSRSAHEPSKTPAKTSAPAPRGQSKQKASSTTAATRTPASSAAAPAPSAPAASAPVPAGRGRRVVPATPPAETAARVSPAAPVKTSATGLFCAATDSKVAYFSAAFAPAHPASQDSAAFAAFLNRRYRYGGGATCADAEDLAGARRALSARVNSARSGGKTVVETGWTDGGGAARPATK